MYGKEIFIIFLFKWFMVDGDGGFYTYKNISLCKWLETYWQHEEKNQNHFKILE